MLPQRERQVNSGDVDSQHQPLDYLSFHPIHSSVTSKDTRRPFSIVARNCARERRGNARRVMCVPAGRLNRARSSSSVMPLRMPSTAMAEVIRDVGRQVMPAGGGGRTRNVVSTSQLPAAPLEGTTQVSSKGTSAR